MPYSIISGLGPIHKSWRSGAHRRDGFARGNFSPRDPIRIRDGARAKVIMCTWIFHEKTATSADDKSSFIQKPRDPYYFKMQSHENT